METLISTRAEYLQKRPRGSAGELLRVECHLPRVMAFLGPLGARGAVCASAQRWRPGARS
jgi:hypothetical protein